MPNELSVLEDSLTWFEQCFVVLWIFYLYDVKVLCNVKLSPDTINIHVNQTRCTYVHTRCSVSLLHSKVWTRLAEIKELYSSGTTLAPKQHRHLSRKLRDQYWRYAVTTIRM